MQYTTSAAHYGQVTLSRLSLVEVALIIAVCLPLAVVVGFFTGRATRRKLLEDGAKIDKVVGQTTLNAFMALLGLLLAFAFGNSLTISQSIKDAITDEAAALGTAFLRVDYLAEPGRGELQAALLDYARTRMVPQGHAIATREQANAFLDATLTAQTRLWPLTLEATRDPTPPPIQAFVAGAVNTVLDAHLYRVATLSVPISALSQFIVLFSSCTALLLLANRTGMLGRTLTWRTFVFSLFLGAVMYAISDVRRASEGLIRVDDSALAATIDEMEQSLATRQAEPSASPEAPRQ